VDVDFHTFFLTFFYGLEKLKGIFNVHINMFLWHGILGAGISINPQKLIVDMLSHGETLDFQFL
jgi:hypothetical protein